MTTLTDILDTSEPNKLHKQEVIKLYQKLLNKDRYFAVGMEVPLWYPSMDKKRGQADVLTIDKNNNRIIYWEVKTGKKYKAKRKASKQANNFRYHMNLHPLYRSWDAHFVYYNPTHHEIRRF